MAELALHSLSKRYGDFHAVREVSLTIADGEFLVLLGPSGCGKTTLLRIIAGLETPDAGQIALGDQAALHQVGADADDVLDVVLAQQGGAEYDIAGFLQKPVDLIPMFAFGNGPMFTL